MPAAPKTKPTVVPKTSPRVQPDPEPNLDFNDWKLRVIERWKAEAGRDAQTRGVSAEDEFSDNLWYYLYERFLHATDTHYKPSNIYQPKTTGTSQTLDSVSGTDIPR